MEQRENVILDLTFKFALEIIEFCEILEKNKKFIISKQLLRSGTGIGANIRESQYAESRHDFVHKLKIAEKESNETEYWLLLCKNSSNYPFNEDLLKQLSSIRNVLSKIIISSKATTD
jgi:four helix bundle protein